MPTIEEALTANRPRYEVKKAYLPDSPGGRRKKARVTLTEIKRLIKAGKVSRAKLRADGLLP